DIAATFHAAKPVVFGIDRRIELPVGAHRYQPIDAFTVFPALREAFRHGKVRLAVRRLPFAFARRQWPWEATRYKETFIEVFELVRIGRLDGVPDQRVIADPLIPIHPRVWRQGCFRHAGDDEGFGSDMLADRLPLAA